MGNRKLSVVSVAYQCEEEIYTMLDSTNGIFPTIISYGKWKDFEGEDRKDLTPEIIDTFSNTITVHSVGLLEPQARNEYLRTAGIMGSDVVIILDTDEYLEFPLGIEFFKRQLERMIKEHPDQLGFRVTFNSKRTGGVSFTPRVILNPMFVRYRDIHNQMYFMDKPVLSSYSEKLVGGIIIHESKENRNKDRELRMRTRNLKNPNH